MWNQVKKNIWKRKDGGCDFTICRESMKCGSEECDIYFLKTKVFLVSGRKDFVETPDVPHKTLEDAQKEAQERIDFLK